jgi:endonuclease YncB( thermonuclease family)
MLRAPRIAILLGLLALLLAACGPQLGDLEKGERARVARVYNGDTLELDSGLRVFLAEIDAPSGEQDYASQARAELEALALHREVQLAYGGEHRWTPRPREGQTEPPRETAIAHLFVRSEGGRWFWLQHQMIARGAAIVRPRRGNAVRSAELLTVEAHARAQESGLWAPRYRNNRVLAARIAADAALAAAESCTRGSAPYRIVEGRVGNAYASERRASLTLDGAAEPAFAIVVFGRNFAEWDGPDLGALTGARIRARGALGVYNGAPQLCLDHAAALEILPDQPR